MRAMAGWGAVLTGDDQDAAGDAVTSLWSRLFPRQRPTPETAPAIRYLLTLLDAPTLGAGDDSIRDSILFLLREVARVATDADGDEAPAACAALRPEIFAALWPIPRHWPSWSRVVAATAAVMAVRDPALATRRAEVVAFHEEAVIAATNRRECATYMIGLGELGAAPAAWLDDPRLAIRVCAALAPALAEDPVAVGQLISAAEQPRVFDNAFSEPFAHPAYRLMLPPQFQDWPRRTLIKTVCERVTDFERLLRAAVAAVDLRFGPSTAPEFGPYLPIAFPNGLPAGVDLSWHQEVFAQAITGRDDLWDGTRRGVIDMFAAAGLPDNRDAWSTARTPMPLDSRERPTYQGIRIMGLTGRQAIRQRPELYLVPQTSPHLPGVLISRLGVDGLTIHREAPLRFTAEAADVTMSWADLELIVASRALHKSLSLSIAAALSIWTTAYLWTAGVTQRQEFVDGVATGAVETVGPTDHADGYRFTFELDRDWLPAEAAIPED